MMLAATKTEPVLFLHQGFSRAVVIYAILMAVWGLGLYVIGQNPSGGYLGALILAEAVAVVEGSIGLVLLIQGHRPPDGLHYLYGVVAVVTLPAAYFMSAGGSERRDSMVFGFASLLLVGVALRGAMTGG